MRQVFYVSDSLVGTESRELDAILERSQNNNTVDGITGLLWTDGKRFAQVIEGDDGAIEELMGRLKADPRHANLRVLEHYSGVRERLYGAWAMVQPAQEPLAEIYERRVRTFLDRAPEPVRSMFLEIISGSPDEP